MKKQGIDAEIARIAELLDVKVGTFKGSGIYMHLQSYATPPVAGDYAWDADFGIIMHTGEGWYPFVCPPKQLAL